MSTLDIRVWLSIAYLIGTLFHILLRAGYAVRSQVNTTPSRWCYVVDHWDTLLIRCGFFGYLLFFAWLSHPDWPSKIAIALMVPEGPANWLTVPQTLGTSAMFGFFIDVVLDSAQSIVAGLTLKFPSLSFLNAVVRGQIPSYDARVVDVAAVNAAVVGDGK